MITLSSDVIVSVSGQCHISCKYLGGFTSCHYQRGDECDSVYMSVSLNVSVITEKLVYEFLFKKS